MFDPDFDPLKTLNDLADNQQILYNNDHKLHTNIKELTAMIAAMRMTIREQQETIDVLINGLAASNKNQEMLLQNLHANIYNNFSASGQH